MPRVPNLPGLDVQEVVRHVTSVPPTAADDEILEVRVIDLQPAMITAAPIRSKDGKVLLAKGYQLTPRIIGLLTHVASEQGIEEPLQVRLPVEARGPCGAS